MVRIILIATVVTGISLFNLSLFARLPMVWSEDRLPVNSQPAAVQNPHGRLKILTLNIAHGRKEAFNQILLSREKIQRNLEEIADLINRQNPDIVALQEADGASRWSGSFDHVAFIADRAGYPWSYQAAHASSWLFTYGTAILSRFPLTEIVKHTFKPSPPTLNKGLLLGQVMWKPDPATDQAIAIDIVSVHLDFSRKKVRRKQIIEITNILAERCNPVVIMGDFNSEWFAEDSVVKRLAENTKMKAYQPGARHLQTYLMKGTRLDWILISGELDFLDYAVLPAVVSDHQAVTATLTFTDR